MSDEGVTFVMREYYGSITNVINYTSITPRDLDFDEDDAGHKKIKELIETWLVAAKDFIDTNRNRDYHEEVRKGDRDEVPAGIENIAERIVANMVAQAKLRRNTSIVNMDDYEVKIINDAVITPAIRKDLKEYPKRARFRILV